MGLLECASGNSIWRGYDYYKDNKVTLFLQTDETAYTAKVKGSGNSIYSVNIDVLHPRKSKCNCPHADGKRIICKHMIAVYFTAFPKEAERIYKEAMEWEEEEEKRQAEIETELMRYIHKMKKSELEEALLQLLYDGPEWQYNRFIQEYLEEDF